MSMSNEEHKSYRERLFWREEDGWMPDDDYSHQEKVLAEEYRFLEMQQEAEEIEGMTIFGTPLKEDE